MNAFRRSSTAPSSALIIGWVLYIGKDVFVPIVFSMLVFYVIVGLTRLQRKLPLVGRFLPLPLRYTLSIVVIGLGLVVHRLPRHREQE